jgi:LEA14-like dessication related protein
MMRLFKSKIFLVLVTLSTVGFILAQTIKYPEFQSIDQFQLLTVDNGICNAAVDFNVYNPNWFSFKGKDLHAEVFYKGSLVAIGSQDSDFNLPKKESSNISMNIDFFLDSLKDELRSFLMKDSIDFSVKISGKFTVFNISKEMELPLKLSSAEFVDKMITEMMSEDGVKTEVLKLKEIGVEYSLFDVGFRFSNKLPFDLKVKEVRSSVYADASLNQKVADWLIKSSLKIKEGETGLIEGEARINNAKSAFTGLIKVMSGNLDYYLNGYVLIEIDDREIQIPLRQHFKVKPLSKEVEIIN